MAGISSGWAPFYNSDNRQLIPIRQIKLVKERIKIEKNYNTNMFDPDPDPDSDPEKTFEKHQTLKLLLRQ